MMKSKRKNELLDYRLTDVLEMNFSKDQKTLRAVKRKLLHRPIKDSNLYSLPSFILEDVLVVIQDGDLKEIKQLYLLNAHKESLRKFEIDHSRLTEETAP